MVERQQTTVLPLAIAFEAQRPPVAKVMADAYHRVASADGDMLEVTRVLERVRTWFLTERDGLNIWRVLSNEIGLADPAALQPALIDLRSWFEKQLFDQQSLRLEKLFSINPETGWREWLRTFAEALAYWRTTLCSSLVESGLPFPDAFREPYDFKKNLRLILHERWPEVHGFFQALAAYEFLPSRTRARLLVTAGQIHLYYFLQTGPALSLFEEAQALEPEYGRVIAALGEYALQNSDYDAADDYLKRAQNAAPDEVDSYVFLGDLAEKRGDLEEARNCHLEATRKASGDSLGYTRLLRLYGRPEFIDKYESQILLLAERAVSVDETARYRTCLDVGDAYLASKLYERAQKSYQQAIDLDPSRLDGHMWKGFAFLDEGPSRFENAEQAFVKAREVAPEAYNSYWGLGQLAERREQWAEAADCYAQVSENLPELQISMLIRIGQMRRYLKQYEAAEAALLEALKLDRSTDSSLFELLDEYDKTEGKAGDIASLFKRVREVIGDDSLEAAYLNRQGNTYFSQQDWQKAAESYESAIRLDSGQAVYYSNLAGAYAPLKRWADARMQFEKAFKLTGQEQEYQTSVALSYNDEGNSFFAQGEYDKAASCYTEAERLAPESPRYPSNRSLAFEQIAHQLAQASSEADATAAKPKLIDVLDRAIADARSAVESARKQEDWSSELSSLASTLDRIERKRRLTACYGAAALTLSLGANSIRIEVANDLATAILNPEGTDLSSEFLEKLVSLRQRILNEHGFLIDPPHFSPLEIPLFQRNYRIQVLDEPAHLGQLDATQNDTQEQLVRHLEDVLLPQLFNLLRHQDTANLLAGSEAPACVDIRDNPRKLHLLTLTLKERLAKGESVADVERICEELKSSFSTVAPDSLDSQPRPPVDGFEPGLTSLTLNISKEWPVSQTEVNTLLAALPMIGLVTFGVLVPQGTLVESESLKGNSFQLEIPGVDLAPATGINADEMWLPIPVETLIDRFPEARPLNSSGQEGSVLRKSDELQREIEAQTYTALSQLDHLGYYIGLMIREHIELFLTADLVEHYLSTIESEFPALVKVMRFFFTIEWLTQYLRIQLREKVSIADLPQVLERVLGEMDAQTAVH